MSKTSKYRSFGLRRDQNMADVANPVEALESILNNLPVVTDETPFKNEDLDAVRGLVSTQISYDQFRQFVGAAPVFDTIDPTSGNVITETIRPIKRVKDSIDDFKKVVGEKGRFGGGNGLTSYFIPSNYILNNATEDGGWDALIEDKISVDYKDPLLIDSNTDFWMTGEFVLDKFSGKFSNSGGGIVFEGVLHLNGLEILHEFAIQHRGAFQWEYYDEDTTSWVQLANYTKRSTSVNVTWVQDADTFVDNGQGGYEVDITPIVTGNTNPLWEDVDFAHRIWQEGCVISQIIMDDGTVVNNPAEGAIINTNTDYMGIEFDLDALLLQLNALGWTLPPAAGGDPLYIYQEIVGLTFRRDYNVLRSMNLAQVFLYKDPTSYNGILVRMFWFLPNLYTDEWQFRDFQLTYLENAMIYTYFNLEAPTFQSSNNLEFVNMLQNSVNLANNSFGTSGNYRDFETNNKITVDYRPNLYENWANVTAAGSQEWIWSDDSNFISTPQGTGLATTALQGTDVLSYPLDFADHAAAVDGEYHFWKTKQNFGDSLIIDSNPATIAADSVICVHLKASVIKDVFIGTSTNDTFTADAAFQTTFNIHKDDRVIIEGVNDGTDAVNSWRVIDVDYDTYTFTVDSNFSFQGQIRVVVIPTSGFSDQSKIDFCDGIFGLKSDASYSAPVNVIGLTSTTGLIQGQVVQFDSAISPGTTITNIDNINNTITLSSPLIGSIPIEAFVTFCPAGTTSNKESCVLPFDVSPPFVGTEQGISTNGKSIVSTFDPFSVVAGQLTSQSNTTVNTIVAGGFGYNRTMKLAERDGFIFKALTRLP